MSMVCYKLNPLSPLSTGTMMAGDQILAINGESLHMKTVPEAVQMLQHSGDVVTLKICKAIKKSSERGGSDGGRVRASDGGRRVRAWWRKRVRV